MRSPKDSALALEVVLADGTILDTGSGARKDVAGYDLVSLFVGLAPQTTVRALAAAGQICVRALEFGGTITGEHGVGVLKQGWLSQQISPAALAVHRAIKARSTPATSSTQAGPSEPPADHQR